MLDGYNYIFLNAKFIFQAEEHQIHSFIVIENKKPTKKIVEEVKLAKLLKLLLKLMKLHSNKGCW